jgi:hypothetical protein
MAGWLTLAAAAPAAGVAAIGALESGITESEDVRPLDRQAVERALNGSGATPASSPRAPAQATPGKDGGLTRVLRAGGGTVTARCGTDGVTLLAWSPAQGYRAEDLVRGPVAVASLTFESAAREYAVTVVCEGGGPVAHTAEDDRGRGRGRGRDD